ncbi:Type I Iterative PKS [Tephrocybe sp. NHM501043]|nr:Type I Iterative PKS [Tephrocybe sp. NHM501043]
MISTGSPDLHLSIFAGQGTSAAASSQARHRALADASSSSGSLLLSACHEAFLQELSCIPTDDFSALDIDMADFTLPKNLLSVLRERYLHNAVISGSTLFLLQILRYLAFVEATCISTGSLTPFSDVLKANSEHNLGILGFSSGILPACVVATSLSTFGYISKAVEAYRLSLWIGIRSHLYRVQTLKAAPLGLDTDLPWSLVFMGIGRDEAEEAIAAFSKGVETEKLYITAIMDDTCVTISGRPDILSAFSNFLTASVSVVIHQTTLNTLYHSPLHATSTRHQVLADAAFRNIRFPEFADVQVPIRSTLTGDVITKDEKSGSLLELVVDMLLLHPVNWRLVIDRVVQSLPQSGQVGLLNVGPGLGLSRSTERAFPRGRTSVIDLSSVSHHEMPQPKQEPVAIIGMAVNMPGAPNVSKLWEVLEQGINTVSEIPEHRFRVSDYNNSQTAKRTMKAYTGNFIEGADEFDNKFFKISPREAKSMDPQQRVLLHTAYEALEDSGYVPNATPTSRPENFGCYIGVATHDYLQNLRDDIDVYYSPGTLKAFLSGRISYAMQLSGPSIVVDTACSSSNVALYQGARALMNRDCDSALVGGVNIITSPDMFLGLDRGHFLSPTGQCKSFDASADGYSRGEGCGVFVLKRLSDAIAENDRILGVIRGIEVNQSGLAHSITHPHAPTQASLFQRVLEKSNIDPHRINVVEAHGTGTQAGDPNELDSIRSIFSIQRPNNNPLHITSIKANIGHLEAASGSAGLAKLLLMFQHQRIPRQISLKTLNPRIVPLDADHTVINTVAVPWRPSSHGLTRIAMLNNFGAAGSNSTLIVEEHVKPFSVGNPDGMHYVFGLSAKDSAALEKLRHKFLDFLESSHAPSLSDIAYTTTARRQIYDHRLSMSANSITDLVAKLRRALTAQVTPKDARVVFVFSGQGGQYIGMGRSLYRTSALFRSHVEECHAILTKGGFPGVLAIINAESEISGLSVLEEFEAYQASIVTLQYALAKLWMSWGLSPAAVVGHSLGEYAALTIGGVISVHDVLHVVASRARLMVQRCAVNESGMIAVNLGPIAIHDVLRTSPQFSDLSIACYNSPTDCVLSGSISALKAFKEYLDTEIHCKNIVLTVPFGYHSQAMSPLLDDLTAAAQRVTFHAPCIPVVSNALGDVVLPGDSSVFTPEYFARHCAEPVRFEKGIQALNGSSMPFDAWIEIGPHATTLPMLKANSILPRGALLLASLRKQQGNWETLTASLSQIYMNGLNVQWRNTFEHLQTINCVSIPSYPFSPSKFWVEYREPAPSDVPEPRLTLPPSLTTEYAMLGQWLQRPSLENGNTAVFETPINRVSGWISGHSVGGMPLCPASVYLEQALSSIQLACSHLRHSMQDSHIVLRKLVFVKPLVYDPSISRKLVSTIVVQDGRGTFSISSRALTTPTEVIHAHGEYRVHATSSTITKFARALPTISRYMAAVGRSSSGSSPEVFSTRTAYEVIFPRVVEYSKEYRTIKSITVDASSMEGCADVCLPDGYDRGRFSVHPVFTDTLLHVAGFVANLQGGLNDAFICSEVDAVKIVPELIDNDASYTVYCTNAWVPEDDMVLADAYAVLSGQPKRIVAHIKGMQFRRVRLDRFKKGLAFASGKHVAPPSKAPSSVPFKVEQSPTLSPSPSVHDTVIKLISETCDLGSQELDINADLASLGVDSLMSIEIYGKLAHSFPSTHLNSHTLSFCTTVADIIREVSAKINLRSRAGGDSPRTTFSGTSTPRTLVPDDAFSDSTRDEERDVKEVLASVLDLATHEIDDDTDFDSLGLDSLTSIEALHALKTELGFDVPSNIFTTFHTPRTLRSYLASQTSNPPKSPQPDATAKSMKRSTPTSSETMTSVLRLDVNPRPIQSSSGGRLPLFLIHDGSGLVNYYERLSPLERPVWAIHNPHFSSSRRWDSIAQMASVYANYIANLTSGPILLGGWSFGGVAAYEVARHLELMGRSTHGILLIDAPSPIAHVPLSDAVIEAALNLDGRSPSSEVGTLVKAQFFMNSRLLGNYKPEPFQRDCPPLVMLRSKEGFSPLGVQVPAWLADRTTPKASTAGWETLSRRNVEVRDIPGNHFEPFLRSNIEAVSVSIRESCAYLEQQ